VEVAGTVSYPVEDIESLAGPLPASSAEPLVEEVTPAISTYPDDLATPDAE
jgi:hypothetical protein